MSNEYELAHWGVKGMKWGVRRSQAQLARARGASKKTKDVHEDYKKAHSSKSVKSMSNQELKDTNNRLQMEKTYASLNKKKSRGKQVVDAFTATATTVMTIGTAAAVYAKYGTKITNAIKQLDKYRTGEIWLY